jgi:HlyD family secretion protein
MTFDAKTVSVGRPLFVGLAALAVLAALVGVWGTQARIAGAVIAHGSIKVEGTTHLVSHEIGGTVRAVNVEDGDMVRTGDVLVVLEDDVLRAKLDGIENELHETLVAEARLKAEAARRPELFMDEELATLRDERPEISAIVERHERQLQLNLAALSRTEAQQHQIKAQIREQIAGAEAELESLTLQTEIVVRDLEVARKLFDRRLGTRTVVSTLEQSYALLLGEIGKVKSASAEKRERLIEVETIVPTLAEGFQTKALEEVSKLQAKKAELLVERAELEVMLARLVIRAPIDGIVHQSHLSGVQSVVLPGVPILSLVPDTGVATALVYARANDIDQVYPGQATSLRFQAYNARSLPNLNGTVLRIAADTEIDPVTKRPMYKVQIKLPLDQMDALENVEIINGMPLVAFMATAEQTPLEYVARPIVDYFLLAFRDTAPV